MNNLRNTFRNALTLKNMSERQFAVKNKTNYANLNNFLKSSNTLSPNLKPIIFNGFDDDSIAITLFDAHIQDEAQAANLKIKATLRFDDEETEDSES